MKIHWLRFKKFAKSQVHKYIKIKPLREDTAGFSFDEKEKIEFQC